jgi:flagellar motor switch protein FliN
MSSSPSSSSSTEGLALPPGIDAVICQVDVLLGSGRISMRDCLQLRRQAVLPLDQPAGADLQVTVNGVPIALGEVVIAEEGTAIRITEIAPAPEGTS